jgi:hypothetical protein
MHARHAGLRYKQGGWIGGPFFAAQAGGVIDDVLTDIFSAYGLTKLVSAYSGPALRVRRSSDNTEQDINFVGTALDTGALATFVGANNGFVVTWYDQSGNGNNFTQATAALQPKLIDAGTYLSEVTFDGGDDYLLTPSSGTPTAFTVVFAGRVRAGMQGGASPSNETVWGHSSGTTFWVSKNGLYSDITQTYASQGAGTKRYANASATDGAVYAARFDRAQVALDDEVKFFVDGVVQASVGDGGNSSTVSGNFTAGAWALGGDAATSYAKLAARSVLIYESAKSDADILTFSTALTPTINTDVFDGRTTGLWGLYSLRRELSAYAGSAIRVRRSSDNTEQDIGFVSGLLDTASLLTFAGAGSAFVTTVYDQSGNGRNLVQATSGQQPRIVNTGALDTRGITFDGLNDVLVSNANSSATNVFSMFVKAWTTTDAATQILLELGAPFNTGRGNVVYVETNGNTHVGTGSTALDYTINHSAANPVNQVMCAQIDRSQVVRGLQTALYSGGRVMSETDLSGGTIPSGNVTAGPWYLGARSSAGTNGFVGSVHTLAIYESIVSAADVETISRLLG